MTKNHPDSREEYRFKQRSGRLLSRNQFFTANKQNVSNKNFKKFLTLVVFLVVGFVATWGSHFYFNLEAAFGNTYQGGTPATQITNKQPISVLILGVDQGIENRHDQGNSDTMILATANPQTQKSTLTSIPRDLLADIKGDNGKYFMFRVNSAYQVGGNKAAMKTTKALLNTPINYYMEVNMKALQELVDAVGGVDVKVPFSFTYNTTFKKGKMHLNGKQALDYARMRKEDPRGDYGRQLRQRQIIMAIVKNALSLNSISNYKKILKAFSKNVTTNMTFSDMMAIAINYRSVANNIKSDYIHGHDAWIDGASIQVASTSELQRVSNYTRANLGLKKQKISNEETRQNRLNENYNAIDWTNPNAFTNYQVFPANSDSAVNSDSGSNYNTTYNNNVSEYDNGGNW
ncbi:LCP family protein [Lactobacillus mulieris]|uniref:LCP family protein n=1 Tax=Lactobacillus mulieris TaxID=2508708 RepID=A0AAW5WXT8_9LACO|nr:LCP family protein [Lactobacillus mulieris]MCZ3621784.1 LCP family protein [Lactobacillus mulieris]MCZ3623481.1 LCP family protein [Lactobacillus mulieris]MCZ3635791.1 LCP family protein [Lactobacillus mulieris]MCZ3689579.1 LCP family protein [Lactobacillus mulieris]MCZ3695582.1 LCP family protein [Lactobacillus mulieris]